MKYGIGWSFVLWMRYFMSCNLNLWWSVAGGHNPWIRWSEHQAMTIWLIVEGLRLFSYISLSPHIALGLKGYLTVIFFLYCPFLLFSNAGVLLLHLGHWDIPLLSKKMRTRTFVTWESISGYIVWFSTWRSPLLSIVFSGTSQISLVSPTARRGT